MPYIAYTDGRFRDGSLAIIAEADRICLEYARQGYNLTLRGLFYQFVARDLFPEERRFRQVGGNRWVRDPDGTKNAEPNYKWLGGLVNDGRLAGLIDWDHISDRTRQLTQLPTWRSPADIIDAVAAQYREDVHADQPSYLEVWVEKDALLEVTQRAANAWQVASYACKGYNSQSALWVAANRHLRMTRAGRRCHVLYLGDHDPSGLDMSRDILNRFQLFCEHAGRSAPTVHRLALNMDQIQALPNLPPSPAKITDSRAAGYIAEFGDDSWELDALDPPTLDGIIQDAIAGLVDHDRLAAARAAAEQRRQLLVAVSRRWPEVADYVSDDGDAS
jgi:hypothetical protein